MSGGDYSEGNGTGYGKKTGIHNGISDDLSHGKNNDLCNGKNSDLSNGKNNDLSNGKNSDLCHGKNNGLCHGKNIGYFEKQIAEFDQSIHSLDEEMFGKWVEEAAGTLQRGHKIIVSGLGKNVPICEKFVGSMISMGLEAYFLHTNSAVHGDMGLVKDGDMVIILTKSGETEESVYLARLLKERQVDMWLLTFNQDSTLAREIPNRIVLDLEHEGDLWNVMPNNSTTMNLIVLQGLAMMVAARMGLGIGQFKRNHPGGHIGAVLAGEE